MSNKTQTKKLPTVYSLFLKYMLSNEKFCNLHGTETNKSKMKKAIEMWNNVCDSQKVIWKQTVYDMQNADIDTLLHVLFHNYEQNVYTSRTDIDIELSKDIPLILSKEQMPNYNRKSGSHSEKTVKKGNRYGRKIKSCECEV